MNEGKVFLDTNVLIYAHDTSAGRKHDLARETVLELWNRTNGLLSTQVLQEFFFTITRKIPTPLKLREGRKIIEDLLSWDVVVNDGRSILAAIEIQERYHYSFWDSLIIQAAIQGDATVLLSEDLSDNQTIRGITIKNPFKSQ